MKTDGASDARALSGEVRLAAGLEGAARTLLLDLDGTLAPIAPTPSQAEVPTGTLSAMRRLVAASWTVAVISGRPWRQVREMVPVPEVPVFGSHGAEGAPDGSSPGPPPGREISDRLERIASRLDAMAAPFPGSLVERKPLGIVAHHRKVAPDRLEAWHRELHACLESLDLRGLELLEGRKIHEVRVAGAGKGRLVERFAALRGVTAFDASFVALGDDRTDEEMFRAIGGLGLSVAVGGEEAGIRARRRLQGPAEVRIFLENLSLPLPNRSVGP